MSSVVLRAGAGITSDEEQSRAPRGGSAAKPKTFFLPISTFPSSTSPSTRATAALSSGPWPRSTSLRLAHAWQDHIELDEAASPIPDEILAALRWRSMARHGESGRCRGPDRGALAVRARARPRRESGWVSALAAIVYSVDGLCVAAGRQRRVWPSLCHPASGAPRSVDYRMRSASSDSIAGRSRPSRSAGEASVTHAVGSL